MGNLFAQIVDDAALFPPARESMATALPAYREASADAVLGRFLCPVSKLAELRDLLIPEDLIDLGLIADTGAEALQGAVATVRAEPRLKLAMAEIPLPGDADQARAAAVTIAQLPAGLPAYIEPRRVSGHREAVQRIAAARERGAPVGAKLRTGGPTADLVPEPEEVAAFVAQCAALRLPFKCTAGMHHAVRHRDQASGLDEHGFLNVLVATGRAITGKGDVEEAVRERDGQRLAAEARTLTPAARELFVSYGSCDIHSPREDLRKLGLIGEDGSP